MTETTQRTTTKLGALGLIVVALSSVAPSKASADEGGDLDGTFDVQPQSIMPVQPHSIMPVQPTLGATSTTSAFSGPPGTAWGTVGRGLAAFVVGRAESEVILWFVDRFKARLCDNGKAVELLVATCREMDSLGKQAFVAGPLFVAALREDVERLPLRLLLKAGLRTDVAVSLRQLYKTTFALTQGKQVYRTIGNLASPELRSRCSAKGNRPELSKHPVACSLTVVGIIVAEVGAQLSARAATPTVSEIKKILEASKLEDVLRAALCRERCTTLPPELTALINGKTKAWTSLQELRGALQNVLRSALSLRQSKTKENVRNLVESMASLSSSMAAWEMFGEDSTELNRATQLLTGAVALIDGSIEEASVELLILATDKGDLVTGVGSVVSVIGNLRKGAAPLDAIAGLSGGAALKKSCLSSTSRPPFEANPVSCTLLTIGLLTKYFGAALVTDGSLSAGQLSQDIKALFCNGKTCLLPPMLKTLGTNPQGKAAKEKLRGLSAQLKQLSRASHSIAENGVSRERLQSLLLSLSGLLVATEQLKLTNLNGQRDIRVAVESIEAVAAAVSGDYTTALRTTFKIGGLDIPQGLREFGAFVVALSEATDPEAVRGALEAAAAPVGSWRLKKASPSITITALVGVGGGIEGIANAQGVERGNLPGKGKLSRATALGFFVPLGLDFSTGGSNDVGLFLSLLDLGQYGWARVSAVNKTTEMNITEASIDSNVNALNLLSLGAYARVRLGDSPFVFGVGGSYSPGLRQIRVVGDDEPRTFSMWRGLAFLAVDVTLFPIHIAESE